LKPGLSECELSDWVVTETTWPEVIFMEVNNKMLEIRRKYHHGKDLPIDITPFLNRDPSKQCNHLKISFPQTYKAPNQPNFAVAIEIIEILQHQQIIDMCTKSQHIPEEQVRNNIKAGLSTSLGDDDVAMIVSDLTIDLADPFMSKIFDIPVRGNTCLHRECFDLETYLMTRSSKPKRQGQPCMADVWKCPLCGKDARPRSLRVDGFLLSVRASLAEQDKLDCKAILVSRNGEWRPKPEVECQKPRTSRTSADADDDDDDKDMVHVQVTTQQKVPKTADVQIIELD